MTASAPAWPASTTPSTAALRDDRTPARSPSPAPASIQVTYWSVDAAGNAEPVRTGWVNIADFYAQSARARARPDVGLVQPRGGHHHHGRRDPRRSLRSAISLTAARCRRCRRREPSRSAAPATTRSCFWALQGALESTRQTGYVNIDVDQAGDHPRRTPVPTRWVKRAGHAQLQRERQGRRACTSIFSSVNGQRAGRRRRSSPFLAPPTHARRRRVQRPATGRWTRPATAEARQVAAP